VKRALLLLIPIFVWGKVHYAKVEPYESVVLKASVSGLVLDADLDAEGTVPDGKTIVYIDDRLERVDLNATQRSMALLEETLKINEEMAALLQKSMMRQESYYHRIEKLPTASTTQKDNAYTAFVSVKNQYLATREKIVSLKRQQTDLAYKVARLKDTIVKKSIKPKGVYLYKLMVRKGDFVAPGTPLARVDDANRAKLVLFLDADELEGIKKRDIYLDGVKTNYHIDKIWRIADEKYLSSYRAEIYIPAPKNYFSKLVKVEIK